MAFIEDRQLNVGSWRMVAFLTPQIWGNVAEGPDAFGDLKSRCFLDVYLAS